MTTPDESRLFIAELHPGLGAYLAERLSGGFDSDLGQARFDAWLSAHAEEGPVAKYLERIGRRPPLSAAEEAELAALARARQDALQQFAEAGDSLTPEVRDELRHVVGDGALAASRLLAANAQLVVDIARRYTDRGLTFWDLIQAGNQGLKRAAEKYDPDKGYRFATYATWWIRQAITRALAAGTPRVPLSAARAAPEDDVLAQEERRLLQFLGRDPSPEELAADLDPEELTADRDPFPNGTAP
jgi:RNA polymerase primary sigma factor